jgi:hypothetical protein
MIKPFIKQIMNTGELPESDLKKKMKVKLQLSLILRAAL